MPLGSVERGELSPTTRAVTLLLLLALVLLAFGGVASNGWIFLDDHEYVTENPHVQAGLSSEGFTWFLRTFHVGNWHPLTSWSHMLDVELFGTSPRGPHLVNLGLFALTALLLVHVLFRWSRSWWASATVGALFALHPLRVESVAWISERKDVLSGLFFVLTLWAWIAWLERRTVGRYALAFLALLLGLLSKSMLITTPCVLLLLETWPLKRREPWTRRLVEKAPLFLLVLVFAPLTLFAQAESGATANLSAAPFVARITTALTAYARYVGKTLVPADLAPLYPYEIGIDPWIPLAAGLGLVVVCVLVVRARRERPHLFLGWFWFLGMLVPVIGLVQVGSQSHADRYTYLPSIGLALALVFEARARIARLPVLRPVFLAGLGVIVIALVLRTRSQVELWHDSKRLFTHTLAVTRDNPTAEKIYGDTLLEEGDFSGAIPHYQRALELAPELQNGHKNLGCALAKLGRPAEAIEHFRIAAEVDPSLENLRNLGWALGDAGRLAEALAPLQRVLAMDEHSALVHTRVGLALANLQRFDEAVQHLERALEIEPGDLDARRGLALAHRAAGRPAAAAAAWRALLERSPDDLETLVNSARLLSTSPEPLVRDGREAVRRAERARAIAPGPEAFIEGVLAAAYAETGRMDDAVAAAARAVELARATGDTSGVARYEAQLAEHRAGRPLRSP